MLIRHCKLLLESKRNELCGRVLVTLYKLSSNIKKEFNENVKDILRELLCRYFGEGSIQGLSTFNKTSWHSENFSINNLNNGENLNKNNNDFIFDEQLNPKQEKTLYSMQCDLLDAGAVDLIIDLIVMEPSYDIFKKSIQLAKALLFGGNDKVQMAFYVKLQEDQKLASRFFNSLKLKMQAAQNRIKADILSGTSNAGRATTTSTAVTPNPQSGGNWLNSNGGETKKHLDLSAKSSLNLPFNEQQQYFDKRNVFSSNSFQNSNWQSTSYQQQTILRHQNRSEIEENLTEFCQGPCHENQNALARHESNGMDIVISLVLNDIRPLADQRMELALEIKSQASKLLLAIMESRDDSENADRVLRLMAHSGTDNSSSFCSSSTSGAKQLIKAIGHAFAMSSTYSPSPSFSSTPSQALNVSNHLQQQMLPENISENEKNIKSFKYLFSWIWPFSKNNFKKPEICLSSNGNNNLNNKQLFEENNKIKENVTSIQNALVDPKEVGHNIFILAQQLGRHSKELFWNLCPENAKDENIKNALTFYQKHTGQIEIVRSDRKMERVLFPIHDICGFLTDETKQSVFVNTEKDAQGSKISDFFDKWNYLFNEMKWQKKLQNRPWLSYFTKRLHLWSRMCFFLSVLLNLILAISYPFEHSQNFGQSLFLSADNPFIYLSFFVSILYLFFFCSPEWHSVGLSFCSQISLFLVMFSSTILLTALFGLLPTLWLLGTLQLIVKCIHITSYSGNKGFVEDYNWKQIFSDSTFLYHLAYLICCLLGLLIHPFIYSLLKDDELELKVPSCETLRMCILTTLNWGLRNGGGIGDVLRSVSPHRNTCFICGLERGRFDNKSVQVTFDEHNENEHNLWHYIYFIVWLQIKDETEFTGPESFVAKCVKNHNLDWFPRMQAISLQKENENNLEEIENNNLQKQQLQLEINNLKEQLQQNQSLLREFGQRMQEIHQLLIIDQQQN
uniref:RIH_assoc domain-containing protein n=1 Tax=Meloidogyne hapla TaxID=6305 RepID=A0A1I8B146_MELHA